VSAGEDPVMARIVRAQQRAVDGDRVGAAELMTVVWADIGGEHGDPLHAVTLAHYLADLQDDPAAELEWDLRALHAADGLTDERARRYHHSLAVRGFYPSLHLNLAADYAKLGDAASARRHLDRAEAALADLPAGDYADMIVGAVARLRADVGVAGDTQAGGEGKT
jgi:hypothetical protein